MGLCRNFTKEISFHSNNLNRKSIIIPCIHKWMCDILTPQHEFHVEQKRGTVSILHLHIAVEFSTKILYYHFCLITYTTVHQAFDQDNNVHNFSLRINLLYNVRTSEQSNPKQKNNR